jgi:hypothetical protein
MVSGCGGDGLRRGRGREKASGAELGRARRLWRPSIAGGGSGAHGERGRRGLGGERSHADFSHIVTRVNSTNVLDEGLRIGEIGRQMNSKVKLVEIGVYRK